MGGEGPDLAFVAMHGVGGEDGTAQELLEILGIPFTGPGAAACARCMNKALAKDAIRGAGLPTPDWFAFNETAFRGIVAPIGRPRGFRVPNLAVFGSGRGGRIVPRFWRSGGCMQLVR